MIGGGDRRRQERVRADWSARFEGDAIVVDGHVVDLSIVSARIRSLSGEPVPVKPGDAGTLTLAFPETAHLEVIRLAATVVRSGSDGIALSFAGLPEVAGRWLRARVLSTDVRRRAPRVALALPIELRVASGQAFAAELVDLSAFGARVRTAQPLEPGTRVAVTMEFSAGQPLVVSALVWSSEGGEAVLAFVNLDPREFNRLGDHVASRLGVRP
jgi:PilZ domain-containing protein